jgi:hypothetical protein
MITISRSFVLVFNVVGGIGIAVARKANRTQSYTDLSIVLVLG